MINPLLSDIYGTGLSATDWHILKAAVLMTAFNNNAPDLPLHLQQHPVAELLYRYHNAPHASVLDKAARQLTGNQPGSWQLLMKS